MTKFHDAAMVGTSGYERNAQDHYCTEPKYVNCLLEHFTPHQYVWEPAAGNLDISMRLKEFGHDVVSSDIHQYDMKLDFIGNFLETTVLPENVRAIITNPPYGKAAEEFIRHALVLTKPVNGQVAMFLRNEFDAGKGRMDLFNQAPFYKKIVVTQRPRWIKDSTGSPRHNYAFFVWDWSHKGNPTIHYSHPDTAPKS